MNFKELMREWDQIYRKERIFIIDPTVEWNPQQSTGYYYLPRIFALNNFNTPLTIISAPHPLDVYLDGQFINEVYEGDIIFPTSLNQRLELKIPSWIFYDPKIPTGDPSLYLQYYPIYDSTNKKFYRPFIFKKGIIQINKVNPFNIYYGVKQFNTEDLDNKTISIYPQYKKFNKLFSTMNMYNDSNNNNNLKHVLYLRSISPVKDMLYIHTIELTAGSGAAKDKTYTFLGLDGYRFDIYVKQFGFDNGGSYLIGIIVFGC